MSGIQSGSTHLIIPKRIFAVVTLVALGGLSGVLVSNHLYNRQVGKFLHEKTRAAHKANWYLMQENYASRALFHKLTVQMDEDAKDGMITQEESGGFHQLAQRFMEGLQRIQDLVGEKDFRLWEYENKLEYIEERLANAEELETEMAAYINKMASQLLKTGKALPAGLADQPYFGAGKKSEEERRRFGPWPHTGPSRVTRSPCSRRGDGVCREK